MIPIANQWHETAVGSEEDKEKKMKMKNSNKVENKPKENIKMKKNNDEEMYGENSNPIGLMKTHRLLGHAGPQITISTIRRLGYRMKHSHKKYKDFGKAKISQKKLNRASHNPAKEKGVRLLVYIP